MQYSKKIILLGKNNYSAFHLTCYAYKYSECVSLLNLGSNLLIRASDGKLPKNTTNKISSKVKVEEIKNKFKPNKNRVIKKDSLRVQQAMRELKLISLEEITSNKKYFS